jgi:CRP/FNR family transcriptional regulator, cyclic AMP receptor protein
MEWALLNSLPEADREAVLATARRRTYRRNEALFHEGDPGDSLHLIAEGHLAVRVTTPMGDVATLRILGAGDYVGELAVISPAPRNATVVALDDVETLSLHRTAIDDLREKHPKVDQMVLDSAIGEVRRLSTQLLEAMYVPVTARVLRRLVDLVALFGETIPLTQDDLAGLAGTSRKTVNEVLGEAQDRGVIRLARGRIEVVDLPGLRRLGQ